jgi:hypothetical protein
MQSSPVAVGGVGGSGTRVVSRALGILGYFMGHDLNEAGDNLDFTLFFKRPEILTVTHVDFCRTVSIFVRLMQGQGVAESDRDFVTALTRADRWGRHSTQWLQQRAAHLPYTPSVDAPISMWGWKEPNTHVVLDRLWAELPRLKYVHVRRHGLDMAFSGNQNQPHFWGEYFLGQPCPIHVDPAYSLRYWCAAEQRVLRMVEQMGKSSQFHALNFDRLCQSPMPEFSALLDFLGHDVTTAVLQTLAGLVSPPASMGRYRERDLAVFATEDLAMVESLGFAV